MAQQSGRDVSAYPPVRLLTGGLLVRVQPGELQSPCKEARTKRAPNSGALKFLPDSLPASEEL